MRQRQRCGLAEREGRAEVEDVLLAMRERLVAGPGAAAAAIDEHEHTPVTPFDASMQSQYSGPPEPNVTAGAGADYDVLFCETWNHGACPPYSAPR
jgi:hypothetical protein